MKAQKESRCIALLRFLTLALDGVWWSTPHPGCSTSAIENRYPKLCGPQGCSSSVYVLKIGMHYVMWFELMCNRNQFSICHSSFKVTVRVQKIVVYVVSGFHHKADENCALTGYDTVSSVIYYRRFGTTYWSYTIFLILDPWRLDLVGCP
jgi:hypothetical protein